MSQRHARQCHHHSRATRGRVPLLAQQQKRALTPADAPPAPTAAAAALIDLCPYPPAHARVAGRVGDYKGKRDYEGIVRFVTRFVNGEPFEEVAAESRPKKAKRTRPSVTTRLGAFATSLLDHDPLQAGLVMLAIAATCGVAMLLALIATSRPSAR